jgi:aryl-alcohol dehydrogenase-like predicted oxidoreductase
MRVGLGVPKDLLLGVGAKARADREVEAGLATGRGGHAVEGHIEKNLRIVDEVEAVASEVDATPAQVALAWLLAQGDDLAPMPGTKRVSRVEENTAVDGIELTAEQIRRLNDLAPATGERHDEANMSTVER